MTARRWACCVPLLVFFVLLNCNSILLCSSVSTIRLLSNDSSLDFVHGGDVLSLERTGLTQLTVTGSMEVEGDFATANVEVHSSLVALANISVGSVATVTGSLAAHNARSEQDVTVHGHVTVDGELLDRNALEQLRWDVAGVRAPVENGDGPSWNHPDSLRSTASGVSAGVDLVTLTGTGNEVYCHRYYCFIVDNGGTMVRYDTRRDFFSPASYVSVDFSSLLSMMQTVIFDDNGNGFVLSDPDGSGVIARFPVDNFVIDEVSSVDTSAVLGFGGWMGGFFFNGYVHALPGLGDASYKILRFAPDFTNLRVDSIPFNGYSGGFMDGSRYGYLVPNNGDSGNHGKFLRIDLLNYPTILTVDLELQSANYVGFGAGVFGRDGYGYMSTERDSMSHFMVRVDLQTFVVENVIMTSVPNYGVWSKMPCILRGFWNGVYATTNDNDIIRLSTDTFTVSSLAWLNTTFSGSIHMAVADNRYAYVVGASSRVGRFLAP